MIDRTRRSFSLALLLAVLGGPTGGAGTDEVLARFTVHAGSHDRLDTPVWVPLDGLLLGLPEQALELHELVAGRRVATPAQRVDGIEPGLCWILKGPTVAGEQRTFELVSRSTAEGSEHTEPTARVTRDDGALTVDVRGQPVLRYQVAPIPAPPGASSLFSRGGFIHPMWSPSGEVLTRVQPPDHLHHLGLWNPWTRTEFEGRTIDFWNLGDGQGTVRVGSVISTLEGAVRGGFHTLHEHVDLKAPGGPKVALNEEWRVGVWDTGGESFLVDFVSTLSCATDSPLTILAYRYQGFGFRATAAWDDETATLLTSEGRDKSNGNATRARWCEVRGPAGDGQAGILFMSHPANHDHPERLRIWPTGTNEGKENVFFNFNPAQDRDWKLEPGRVYTLRYRMLVHDGVVDVGRAEQAWRDFADPPRVVRE